MSTTAEVAIINTALAMLGQEPVSDLADASLERSLSATKLLRHLEISRDTVLRRHGWLCALKYTTLTPVEILGEVNWRYPTIYELPGNGLRVWEIEGDRCDRFGHWGPRWQVNTIDGEDGAARTVIRAQNGTDQLNIAYVRRANWTALDPHVADAVAADVAARGAYSVTGDQAKALKVAQAAEQSVQMAISVDGTQEGNQPPLAPSIPAMLRNMSR